MHDTLSRLSRIPLYRRFFGLALFVGLLVGFRHLALVGVTLVVLARGLGALGGIVGRFLKRSERVGVLLCLGLLLLTLFGVGFGMFHIGTRYYAELMALRSGRPLTDLMSELQAEAVSRLPGWIHFEDLKDKIPELVTPAMTYLRATGRMLLHVLLGIVLAIIYLLDRQPVDDMLSDIPGDSILGALRRYFSFLGEAIVITITLQFVVAIVNTVFTLPILVALRLPHLLGFTLLLFLSSLVPVVGNLVSGAVLIVAAYVYKGPIAVAVFVGSTFLLHKIEAYVLNPRLASRHVNLPSFVLIVSLVLFEHAFGLVGLFLSFPALYVAMNIAADLRGADPIDPVLAEHEHAQHHAPAHDEAPKSAKPASVPASRPTPAPPTASAAKKPPTKKRR
ncbi:MAG TPA: AI-2E family transporter [Pseudomonadota bacterium]|jgi:predicted PurR-regulated permease PerM|nr:AI-2E family transporter [Pseudomonadota bacterium]